MRLLAFSILLIGLAPAFALAQTSGLPAFSDKPLAEASEKPDPGLKHEEETSPEDPERVALREEAWRAVVLQGTLVKSVLVVHAPGIEPPLAEVTAKQQYIALLNRFLADFPEAANPHRDEADALLAFAKNGLFPNPESASEGKRRRDRFEPFGMRLLWGGLNAGLELKLLTYRKRHLVVDIVRVGAAAGRDFIGEPRLNAWIGPAVGAQVPLFPDWSDELRFLAGLAGGVQKGGWGLGTAYLTLEVGYVHHFEQALSMEVGVECVASLISYVPFAFPPALLVTYVGFKL